MIRLLALRLAAVLLYASANAPAEARRVIVFKFDGLNAALIEKWMSTEDSRTGRTQLPWINEIFGHNGTRLTNFFVRGISLSAPSWAELDTGRHSVIRGNVEYDRWTLEAYDYLNFVPFYMDYARKKQADMPGVEVLDQTGTPLLIDAFRPEQRWQSYQIYQRGNKWSVLKRSVPDYFKTRTPRQLFEEYETGLDLSETVLQEQERELIDALADDRITYLDLFSGDYDHAAHASNDLKSQRLAMQSLDALVGRIWTAARASKLGPDTLFVLVSDHGMNTTPDVLSQGYSLVDWFNSAAGGGHHVITDRYTLSTFKLWGLDPLIHKVTNPSSASAYLNRQAEEYPTVLLDVDGNERAAVQLRANTWNIAQILLQSLTDPKLGTNVKSAVRAELSRWAELRAAQWAKEKADLQKTLGAAARAAEQASANFSALDRKWTPEELANGRVLEARRWEVLAAQLHQQQQEYRQFSRGMDAFVAMPGNASESLVPKKSLGDPNSLFDLQNYVVGLGPGGLKLDASGRLDMQNSFRRIDYFDALTQIRLRNRVQAGISNQPIDFLATRLDAHQAEDALAESGLLAAVWLYRTPERQALALYREHAGALQIRYLPISGLQAAADGRLSFRPAAWSPGFPLELWEDAALLVPGGAARDQWLSGWHFESEWFAALAPARYSNGLIGLSELFRPLAVTAPVWATGLSAEDQACLKDFEAMRRDLVQPDFEIFAADHWNFNVRNFNPGGNHGAFFRESTRSVLMFSGSGVPRGAVIEQPEDSLSFTPTILSLMGRSLRDFPGKPIQFPGSASLRSSPASGFVPSQPRPATPGHP